MQDKSYRLNTPTLAIVACEGQRIPATIPHGAIVTVLQTDTVSEADFHSNRLVNVIWDGRTAMLFAHDICERGELVNGVGL